MIPLQARPLDQPTVVTDVSLPRVRVFCDPVTCRDVGPVVETGG